MKKLICLVTALTLLVSCSKQDEKKDNEKKVDHAEKKAKKLINKHLK